MKAGIMAYLQVWSSRSMSRRGVEAAWVGQRLKLSYRTPSTQCLKAVVAREAGRGEKLETEGKSEEQVDTKEIIRCLLRFIVKS
ncbi:hypothetical protein E2C01_002850 [Portunus trituberculatus]|uniref:Uncharacterized protein n=1 Tax=Portunus trituberculatus TaxID=210409 RepID=A0A5B7CMB8_PORTR|nr:hypothetical protein [Portunus trituberculatus]